MPNLEDCVIRFGDPNSTMVRVEMEDTGSIILIMIVATICLIKVIRAAKKSD